ncbi:hypothetical protein IPH92_01420 [Candidatus Kaiserbacteria bacterium]|nr:MAG: hypothetical protein IPH92_01420 [Candidatus Kaiserbacteria bacterium]
MANAFESKVAKRVTMATTMGASAILSAKVVEIKERYETPWAGTASYHIKGMTQRVRRSEVTLLKDQSTPLTTPTTSVKKPWNPFKVFLW